VLVITLDRPKKKNAFSKKMYEELERALRAASENEAVRVIHLTGSGDYYSSGNHYDFIDDTIDTFLLLLLILYYEITIIIRKRSFKL
jgi:enoyl-CoA hydratase/carnithine racemase